MSEKFFITMPDNAKRKRHFPENLVAELESMGSVGWNPFTRKMTEEELCQLGGDATILLTHWGSPQVTEMYLKHNPNLKLIAHCAGTVAHIASEATYAAGIPCLSANSVMARYVAEAVLGLIISGMRGFKGNDLLMQKGVWDKSFPTKSLLDSTVGLVGLGTIGRNLLDLLAPFETRVLIFDPYITEDAIARWPNAKLASFEQVLDTDVVSVHASQTPETYHMINEEAFKKMRDGAVFINTSRGSLVDTAAARKMIEKKHLQAAFDVYEQEECAQDLLIGCDSIVMQPHMSATPAGAKMTEEIIKDIKRFLKGEKLTLSITYQQFSYMTQE